MDEAGDRASRSTVLAACVEVMLATGDVAGARAGADELRGLAADLGAPLLTAVSAHATGAVQLAEGNPRGALDTLRRAWSGWCELDGPCEAARVRVLLGLACRQLGDDDGTQLEWDAARVAFEQLGAAPDLARLAAVSRTAVANAAGGLSARETEVLVLVTAGKTNREIAAELVITSTPLAATSRTSSPSSGCPRGLRPPPTRSATTWSEPASGTNGPCRRGEKLAHAGDASSTGSCVAS